MDPVPSTVYTQIYGSGEHQKTIEYQFGNTLGDGQYGTVWLAEATTSGSLSALLRTQVAVKLLNDHHEIKNSELEILKQIECVRETRPRDARNIVVFLNEFKINDMYGLVFERFRGTLHDVISLYSERDTGLDVQFVKFCTGEILQGLSFLHSIGIAHLDLKPGNILTSKTAAEIDENEHGLVLCIADFGSAKSATTPMPAHCGSCEYNAPEVQFEREIGVKSDIWSTMCIVFELLTGLLLFDIFESDETKYDADVESLSGASRCGDSACDDADDGASVCGDVDDDASSGASDGNMDYEEKYRYWLLVARIIGLPPDSMKTDEMFNTLGNLKYDTVLQRVSVSDIILFNIECDPVAAEEIGCFIESGLRWREEDRASACELLKNAWLNGISY